MVERKKKQFHAFTTLSPFCFFLIWNKVRHGWAFYQLGQQKFCWQKCWVNNFFCLTNRADEEGSACNVSAVNVTYCCPSSHPTAPLIGRPKSANYLGVAIKYLSVLTSDRWNGSSSELQCNNRAAFPPILQVEQLDKVNRCLARYSLRATTTNWPTNRAPKKPAWPGPYQPKMPILGQIWSFLGKKSFFLLEKS